MSLAQMGISEPDYLGLLLVFILLSIGSGWALNDIFHKRR